MAKSPLALLSGIGLIVVLSSFTGYAQSSTPSKAPPRPDQVIQDLLTEVHQLRIAMQYMSVNAYRGQIMVERLRLQQDQVSRLATQLNGIRNEIADLKSAQLATKQRLEEAEKQQDKGVVSEAQVSEVRSALSDLDRRIEFSKEREAQLSLEMEQERANLADLNKRLDDLEREIMMTGLGDDLKANPKR